MCCCNGNGGGSSCGCGCRNTCGCSSSGGWGCGCGCGSSGGVTTLPSFPDLPVYPGGAAVSNTRWPVYVSYPAFLYDAAVEADTCGCGCGCG